MPREASGTYTPLPSRSSISFRDEAALSRDARRHGAPALVGDLCARRRNDTPFIATRESIERSSPSRGTNGGGGESDTEREGKKRDEILQDGRNFTLADGDEYHSTSPLSLRRLASAVMFRACHPRRWSCQPYRNRYPPVVRLSPRLFISANAGPGCFPSRLHFTLLI